MTNTIIKESIRHEHKKYEKRILSLTDTPFGYTLSMIGGKWRLVILYWLVEDETLRFNELQRKIGTITYKTLSAQLNEYSLSKKGRSLLPIMEAMCSWGADYGG